MASSELVSTSSNTQRYTPTKSQTPAIWFSSLRFIWCRRVLFRFCACTGFCLVLHHWKNVRTKKRKMFFRVRSYFEKTVEGLKARKIDQGTADATGVSRAKSDYDIWTTRWFCVVIHQKKVTLIFPSGTWDRQWKNCWLQWMVTKTSTSTYQSELSFASSRT